MSGSGEGAERGTEVRSGWDPRAGLPGELRGGVHLATVAGTQGWAPFESQLPTGEQERNPRALSWSECSGEARGPLIGLVPPPCHLGGAQVCSSLEGEGAQCLTSTWEQTEMQQDPAWGGR